MAPLFSQCLNLPNVTLPQKWIKIINESNTKQIDRSIDKMPNAVTEQTLDYFCKKYKHQIAMGIKELHQKKKLKESASCFINFKKTIPPL